jgi:hypothetical protein
MFLILFINSMPVINSIKRNSNFSASQIFIIISSLILFIGFRGFIYTDWISYYPFYQECPGLFDGKHAINNFLLKYSSWEQGFVLSSIIFKTFIKNYHLWILILFLIDLIVLYSFFKEYIGKYIAFGFLFFYLFAGLGGEVNLLRNSKAIMIFLLAIKYIIRRKIIFYYLFVLIACLFHISSIIFIPLYFILNKKIKTKFMLCLFILGNVIYLFQIQWCRNLLILI